jgi:hypothetical protein
MKGHEEGACVEIADLFRRFPSTAVAGCVAGQLAEADEWLRRQGPKVR